MQDKRRRATANPSPPVNSIRPSQPIQRNANPSPPVNSISPSQPIQPTAGSRTPKRLDSGGDGPLRPAAESTGAGPAHTGQRATASPSHKIQHNTKVASLLQIQAQAKTLCSPLSLWCISAGLQSLSGSSDLLRAWLLQRLAYCIQNLSRKACAASGHGAGGVSGVGGWWGGGGVVWWVRWVGSCACVAGFKQRSALSFPCQRAAARRLLPAAAAERRLPRGRAQQPDRARWKAAERSVRSRWPGSVAAGGCGRLCTPMHKLPRS